MDAILDFSERLRAQYTMLYVHIIMPLVIFDCNQNIGEDSQQRSR